MTDPPTGAEVSEPSGGDAEAGDDGEIRAVLRDRSRPTRPAAGRTLRRTYLPLVVLVLVLFALGAWLAVS